jgi:hypothetical protein
MKQIFVAKMMFLVLATVAIGIGTGITTMPQHANAQCYACGWFSSHHDHIDNNDNEGSNNGGNGDDN